MNEQNPEGLKIIRRALLSVSDKTGLVDFARALAGFGVELLSTGGTAKALREAGLDVRDVSDVTGFPEMMDGRVKTLHPRIHGGILAVRDNPEHARALAEHVISPIDMVVVNLYPFEQTIAREGVTLEEAVEQIDIGGPSMVRSAAKNFRDVAVLVSPESYPLVSEQLKQTGGRLSFSTRSWLALTAFMHTSRYDDAIFRHLGEALSVKSAEAETVELESSFTITEYVKTDLTESLFASDGPSPAHVSPLLEKRSDLRYGENPHQKAALYGVGEESGHRPRRTARWQGDVLQQLR